MDYVNHGGKGAVSARSLPLVLDGHGYCPPNMGVLDGIYSVSTVKFKIMLLYFKAPNNQGPDYLKDLSVQNFEIYVEIYVHQVIC